TSNEESTVMKLRIRMALALVAGTLAVTTSGRAQSTAPSGVHLAPGQWAVDGSIGFAVPVGDYGTFLSTGLDLMGAAEYRPSSSPFYFRGEVGYSHFGGSCGFGVDCGSSNVLRIDADALYDFPLQNTKLNVYALGGVGLYHVTAGADVCAVVNGVAISCSTSSTGFGINLGGGIRYPVNPVQLFFELRYHLALTGPGGLSDAPFFPFQFGVRYPLPR